MTDDTLIRRLAELADHAEHMADVLRTLADAAEQDGPATERR